MTKVGCGIAGFATKEIAPLFQKAIEVENIYRNIVGDLINKLTLSVRYERNILYIKLASAALRNELSYKKQSLVDKINGQLKHGAVNEIIFE